MLRFSRKSLLFIVLAMVVATVAFANQLEIVRYIDVGSLTSDYINIEPINTSSWGIKSVDAMVHANCENAVGARARARLIKSGYALLSTGWVNPGYENADSANFWTSVVNGSYFVYEIDLIDSSRVRPHGEIKVYLGLNI